MSNYWGERAAKAQQKLTSKSIRATEIQLRKYYASSMEKILGQFELTYNKVISRVDEGKTPTPADLYKLDTYWQLQGQLRAELRKLGERQAVLLSKQFEEHFFDIYFSIGLPGEPMFNTLDNAMVQQMINTIWCADGISWSQRIWTNTEKLQEALNNNLIHCVATGKKTTELKKLLQEDFGVSYNRADSLVRTEIAHIQTQAAQKRYEDYGIQQVEVLVDEDERTCPICAKHEGEKYFINEQMPVPFHPRCRCCMIPVID